MNIYFQTIFNKVRVSVCLFIYWMKIFDSCQNQWGIAVFKKIRDCIIDPVKKIKNVNFLFICLSPIPKNGCLITSLHLRLACELLLAFLYIKLKSFFEA